MAVLEKATEVATSQTGHNSGVIHAGIYYAPGSLKARLCVEGAREMYPYCEEHGIAHERCGKLIVALHEGELAALDELERRGRANGVPGLRRLGARSCASSSRTAAGAAALLSPATGIVDFPGGALAGGRAGGRRRAGRHGLRGHGEGPRPGRVVLEHARGATAARFAVSAPELADRLAVAAGAPADPRIVPFRGAYLRLRPERRTSCGR